MKAKILITASTLPRWDNDSEPRFISDLALALSKYFTVHILAPWYPGALKEEEVDGYSIHRYQFWPKRGPQLTGDGGILSNLKQHNYLWLALIPYFFSQLFSISRICRRHNISLIHAHWVVPQGLISLAYKLLCLKKIDYIVTLHGGDHYTSERSIAKKIKHVILKKAFKISTVSQTIKDDLLLSNPNLDISVIPMGIDTKKGFKLVKNQSQREGIIFVGRLVEKKGVETLISAMKILSERGITKSLTIAGNGPLLPNLQQQVKNLQIEDKVQFVGFIPHENLSDIFNNHEIAVIPSIQAKNGDKEGFGLTVIEAMACGCAVITSDLPAFNDAIKPNITGIISKAADPTSIANAINQIIDDENYRNTISQNGYQFAKNNFDWSIIGKKYAMLLSSN